MLFHTDGTRVPTFPALDEGTHAAAPDSHWQESFLLLWGDLKNDCGGLLRIGHSPNLNGGEMTVWAHAYTPNWIYTSDRDYPKEEQDWGPSGQSAGGVGSYEFDGAETVWRYDEEDISFTFRTESFHSPVSLWRSQEGNLAYPHSEAACRVTGELTLRGEKHVIDGVGLRDHSWGVRDWTKGKVHRWFNAVFGPDLSMCLLTMHSRGEPIRRLGYVIRDGVVHYSTDVDILVYMEPDGSTHRGGAGRIKLEDGEVLEFTAEPITKGMYVSRHGRYLFESLCRVSHQGREGVGDFEITENCHVGAEEPTDLVNGLIQNGIHPRHERAATR
ncbi:hypothetical protein NUH86_06325 [Sphingobium sp. JS3065]|uniref:DUF7065 domain-containing protein n=1 Tax=Sphingobium sp. JS3065 TaxID=2970925 RepID=UPI002264BE4B|nr:hypothetical protein [Sphingobium sp. JS3065]UZW56388.1 hypothetical protein NUH86_06325 [Sphingobium sp. JS3065]